MINCPNCGARNQSGSTLCRACSSHLNKAMPLAATPEARVVLCGSCGAENKEGDEACQRCGEMIADEDLPVYGQCCVQAPNSEEARYKECGRDLGENVSPKTSAGGSKTPRFVEINSLGAKCCFAMILGPLVCRGLICVASQEQLIIVYRALEKVQSNMLLFVVVFFIGLLCSNYVIKFLDDSLRPISKGGIEHSVIVVVAVAWALGEFIFFPPQKLVEMLEQKMVGLTTHRPDAKWGLGGELVRACRMLELAPLQSDHGVSIRNNSKWRADVTSIRTAYLVPDKRSQTWTPLSVLDIPSHGAVLRPGTTSELNYSSAELGSPDIFVAATTVRIGRGFHPDYGIAVLDPPLEVILSCKFKLKNNKYMFLKGARHIPVPAR